MHRLANLLLASTLAVSMTIPAASASAQDSYRDRNTQYEADQAAYNAQMRDYNAARFFEAHEAWESVWLHAPQPEKTFLQGLIQVTVAFHHLQRENTLGATRLLTAALRKLEPHSPHFCGISVAPLCDDIRDRLESLTAHPYNLALTPPRIHLL